MAWDLPFRCWRVCYRRYGGCSLRLLSYYPCQKLLVAETESREWDTCPVLWVAGYYLMCELWLELVQVQAGFAPAMPLWVTLPKLLTPVKVSQAICFPLSTGKEQGWHARAFMEMQCSVQVWTPSWYACTWFCNGCMESERKETWNFLKDKAVCCGHWPAGAEGMVTLIPITRPLVN